MSKEEDEAEKTARSFLDSQRLNRIADYVSRGRAFGQLATNAVEEGWRKSMKAMSGCYTTLLFLFCSPRMRMTDTYRIAKSLADHVESVTVYLARDMGIEPAMLRVMEHLQIVLQDAIEGRPPR